jgi:hypothetical protein
MIDRPSEADNTCRPHFDRLVQLIGANLAFARENPDLVREVASRMGAHLDPVLAVAIADQIVAEFDLFPRDQGDEPGLKVYP